METLGLKLASFFFDFNRINRARSIMCWEESNRHCHCQMSNVNDVEVYSLNWNFHSAYSCDETTPAFVFFSIFPCIIFLEAYESVPGGGHVCATSGLWFWPVNSLPWIGLEAMPSDGSENSQSSVGSPLFFFIVVVVFFNWSTFDNTSFVFYYIH